MELYERRLCAQVCVVGRCESAHVWLCMEVVCCALVFTFCVRSRRCRVSSPNPLSGSGLSFAKGVTPMDFPRQKRKTTVCRELPGRVADTHLHRCTRASPTWPLARPAFTSR